ncbi:hypothetical protein P9112_010097 [Eukaryota sp. TZLM1-RC]
MQFICPAYLLFKNSDLFFGKCLFVLGKCGVIGFDFLPPSLDLFAFHYDNSRSGDRFPLSFWVTEARHYQFLGPPSDIKARSISNCRHYSLLVGSASLFYLSSARNFIPLQLLSPFSTLI